MDKQQFEQYNSIPKEKFVFAKRAETIRDTKLETKAVSHARDSFRRFCKNKASVVAAIILGIIILIAIFGPIITGVDTDRINLDLNFLAPKLFNAGTGFWDGTERYEHQIYDVDAQQPVDVDPKAVLSIEIDDEVSYVNSPSPYAKGGYVTFENMVSDGKTVNTLVSDTFNVTSSGNYALNVKLGNTDDINGGKLGEFRIVLTGGAKDIVLQDWSTNYSNVAVSISDKMTAQGVDSINNAQLSFELKAAQGVNSYLLISSCEISASDGVSNLERLSVVGFDNPSLMVLLQKGSNDEFPAGYWTCNGRKGVYACEVVYCSYVYDKYEAVFGETELTYTKSKLDEYVKNGWLSYTFDRTTKEIEYEVLSDKCPFKEILSVTVNPTTGGLSSVTVYTYKYYDYGYTSMPKFLFGTDATGVDLFTKVFKGLRTSLLLGVVTFAVCFLFGLVWGAISGYFGGWVDLSMERFCEILSGVPWIVVMTLCILHLGNNLGTFVLALCLTGWMGTAGLTRTQFYRFKGMEHVLAARTLGSSDWRLIFKHIIPNSLGTIITSSVLMIPDVIYSEASLAYLNLGLQGQSSFGVILSDNQKFLSSHAYLILIPSVVMALLMISFNLFGNGLRDAVNPTLKGSEG